MYIHPPPPPPPPPLFLFGMYIYVCIYVYIYICMYNMYQKKRKGRKIGGKNLKPFLFILYYTVNLET